MFSSICNMFWKLQLLRGSIHPRIMMIFILESNAVFHRASWLLPVQLPHYPCHSSFYFRDVIYFYQWRPTFKLQNVMMIYIRRKLSSSSSIDSLNTKFFNWKKKLRNWDWEYCYCCCCWQFLCLVKICISEARTLFVKASRLRDFAAPPTTPAKQARSKSPQDFLNKTKNAGGNEGPSLTRGTVHCVSPRFWSVRWVETMTVEGHDETPLK
jgi:hypothetical protein